MQRSDSETERFEQYQEDVIDEIVESKRVELKPLIKQYNKLIGQANKVGRRVEKLMAPTGGDYDFEPEYPEASSLIVDDEKTPLLDTQISYEEQLKRYRDGNSKTSDIEGNSEQNEEEREK